MEQPGVLVGLITPLFRAAASAKSGGAKTACNRSGERDPKVGGSNAGLKASRDAFQLTIHLPLYSYFWIFQYAKPEKAIISAIPYNSSPGKLGA